MGRSRGTGRPIPISPSGVSDTDRSSSGSPDELRRRFQILERVAIFFTLPDNILHAIARRLAPASAAKGSVIVHQGDPGDTMFIVESGRCEVYVEESPGHTITIALMGPDDFFGELALISEETRTASVRALEDCRLLTLDRKTLYETVPAESDALIELTKLVEQRKDTLPNLIARARMVAPEQAASTVAIYSPKGGSGRTTIGVNLAASLARRFPGEVLLVDLALPYNHAALISYLTPTGCLAASSQVPPQNFEEAVLGAILHHPGGMMLLPGVLRAEQADLISVDLVNRAMGILVNAFRYIVFDLGVAFTDIVISVLDHSQRVLVIVIEQAVVSLTPEAQSRLKELLSKEDNPQLALRIFVSGGGCSGMQYGMAFDDQRRVDDLIVEHEGVQIIVDDFSVSYIRGSEIDYVDSLMGAGFTVHNPNAVHSCSCGHSFDTGDDAGGAQACGCGH